ncbi:DNA cytosine methyltransferase [Picosynechococcus sp. PCC 73109]|uniref:DNA cytosine methyltransferase n=1 Tax=Picosynechococcus sp. PCC 73109 TaxID=374982 RepID=UPI0007458C07|nr:DNA cytosine methyltransferase [Picosynechococcus sp. PCC 73109]AMA08176.1 modification methylase SinI [Picosynechococcus sp. PCC 73109]
MSIGTHTQYTIKDAARKLKVSEQRVRTLCRTGKIASRKIGNMWFLDENSVRSYGLRSGNLLAENHQIYRINSYPKPIALSFFSGAMGLDLGIHKAGFDVRLTCEVDKFCRQTISLNKPDAALLGDILQYNAQEVRSAAGLKKDDDIDLIVGGPPCQAFSTAGKRQGFNDSRGNIFLKYIDLCLELNPKYFVIENVRGLLSCPLLHRPHDQRGDKFPPLHKHEQKGSALSFILKKIEKSNYSFSFNLYNAANFGTPQIRERVIIICSRDGKRPPFLVPTHSENGEFNLPKWRSFQSCTMGIKKHHHLNFPEKRLKYYRLLEPGQNWKNLPLELQQEAMGKSFYSGGGKTGFLRRLSWDRPSPTLVTHPAMPATDLAHPTENRPLSIEEYRRIQEFPDDWELSGSLIQQYKQVGNAVPVGLGYAIGVLVFNLLHGIKNKSLDGFKYSRYKNTSDLDWNKEFNSQVQLALNLV